MGREDDLNKIVELLKEDEPGKATRRQQIIGIGVVTLMVAFMVGLFFFFHHSYKTKVEQVSDDSWDVLLDAEDDWVDSGITVYKHGFLQVTAGNNGICLIRCGNQQYKIWKNDIHRFEQDG